ncbi:patatin-like phospholipase family protein [Gallaecimonas pentaromativorans]|uniref:patatin-like phospholipase family protein n=1 Tax=Gallaecimonas pentaromativorans TaxID=584787 RepID=UPI003A914AF5
MPKVILSLDGGGIRGAAISQFLAQVEDELVERHGKKLRDCVDFYAGTSTGSIIALALATTDMTMADINSLYDHDSAQAIFKDNRGWFEVDGINAPKYEANGKTQTLETHFRHARLADVPPNKDVLVVAYGVENRMPVVLKSTKSEHRELFSSDAADASSAAPTYFPTRNAVIGGKEQWLVDGGVTANNPTLCAIAEVRRKWGTPLADIKVLSIGTGHRTRKINGPESAKWGAIQWMTQGHILDVLSDERVVAYQAITLANTGNYIRVNAELRRQPGLPHPPSDEMDDISAGNIDKLKALGRFWFNAYGEATLALLTGEPLLHSLDGINPDTGAPEPYPPQF